jgi:hypothetical protein
VLINFLSNLNWIFLQNSPKTKNSQMEVHTHTHTARKKWTHYFWEFLMLFLAVFCGFLAEYQLEHKIEKERGMQYIHSFYEDLKSDTAEFSWIITQFDKKRDVFKKNKECYTLLPKQLKSYSPCIADLFNVAGGFPDLITEDRTLQQLKNAGGLRLLKKEDADSILVYDRMIRIYSRVEATGLQECQYRLREQMSSMISYKNLVLTNEDPAIPFLNTDDMQKIDKFFVTLGEYDFNCYSMNRKVKQMKEKAINLIKYFKNKYHFE